MCFSCICLFDVRVSFVLFLFHLGVGGSLRFVNLDFSINFYIPAARLYHTIYRKLAPREKCK